MIEVPAKIWRPKVINKYTAPDIDDKYLDDLLDYGQYGITCVYKPTLYWDGGAKRLDLMHFDPSKYCVKLSKDLSFDSSVVSATKL